MPVYSRTYSSLMTNNRWLTRHGQVETPKPMGGYTGVRSYNSRDARAWGDFSPGTSQFYFPAWDQPMITRFVESEIPALTRQAARTFRAKCQGDTAGLGINIVQWRQGLNMMAKRLGTLRNFASLIPAAAPILFYQNLLARRRALRALARSLNYPSNSARVKALERRSNQEWRDKIRCPGDLFLEFWFGWSPIVNDIYQATKILSNPGTVTRPVRAKAQQSINGVYKSNSVVPYTLYLATGQCSLGIFARVSVSNPNAYLANKLGLANPAVIALDAIPWSWMFGWFVNVKEFCEQLTWDAGLTINSAGSGLRWQLNLIGTDVRQPGWPWKKLYGGSNATQLLRTVGLPYEVGNVRLRLNAPTGSASRAATAASILVQKIAKFSIPFHLRK